MMTSGDIDKLKDFTEGNFNRDKLENYKGSYKMGYFYYKDIQQALERLLSNYKRVLKENEKLKEDRDKFKKALGKRITYCNELEKDLFENCSNYVIPKQIVKDKIEEYKNMLKTCNKVKDIDRIKAINERILELQELLEGRR